MFTGELLWNPEGIAKTLIRENADSPRVEGETNHHG